MQAGINKTACMEILYFICIFLVFKILVSVSTFFILLGLLGRNTVLMQSCQFFPLLVLPADILLYCYNTRKHGSFLHGHKSIWRPLLASVCSHVMHFFPAFCILLYLVNICRHICYRLQNGTGMALKSGYNTVLYCYNVVHASFLHGSGGNNSR